MPVYEYRCTDCDVKFEKLVRQDHSVNCPDCGSERLTKLVSAHAVLSGKANRPADRTCCGRDGRCDAPACSQGSACRGERAGYLPA